MSMMLLTTPPSASDVSAILEIINALHTGRSSGVRLGPRGQLLPGRTVEKPGGYDAAGVTAGISAGERYVCQAPNGVITYVVKLTVTTRYFFTGKNGKPSRWVIGTGSALMEYRRGS